MMSGKKKKCKGKGARRKEYDDDDEMHHHHLVQNPSSCGSCLPTKNEKTAQVVEEFPLGFVSTDSFANGRRSCPSLLFRTDDHSAADVCVSQVFDSWVLCAPTTTKKKKKKNYTKPSSRETQSDRDFFKTQAPAVNGNQAPPNGHASSKEREFWQDLVRQRKLYTEVFGKQVNEEEECWPGSKTNTAAGSKRTPPAASTSSMSKMTRGGVCSSPLAAACPLLPLASCAGGESAATTPLRSKNNIRTRRENNNSNNNNVYSWFDHPSLHSKQATHWSSVPARVNKANHNTKIIYCTPSLSMDHHQQQQQLTDTTPICWMHPRAGSRLEEEDNNSTPPIWMPQTKMLNRRRLGRVCWGGTTHCALLKNILRPTTTTTRSSYKKTKR